MSNTNMVTNLNADLLDGNHASAFATAGHTHSNYLERLAWWSYSDSHNVDNLTTGTTFAYSSHNAPTTGTIVAFSCTYGTYQLQLQGQYGGENLYFRNKNGDNETWNAWRYVIHNGNIGSQSVKYANSAGSVPWEYVTGKPINFKAYSGSLASGGWKIMQGNNFSPSIAISYNNEPASWNSGSYSATLVYGCTDTRGLLDCAYRTPMVTFGGCSYGNSDDNNPAWYMKLSGTNGTTYNLDSMPYATSSGSATKSDYLTTRYIGSDGDTIAQVKQKILDSYTSLAGKQGYSIEVNYSFVSKYQNDNYVIQPDGIYSLTYLTPGYDGKSYGQWLAACLGSERLYVFGRSNNQWTERKTIAWTSDIPTSLPANGGNADTVDNQHFSYSNDSNYPTYLWATNSNGTSFLAARGSISVNYSNRAAYLDGHNVNPDNSHPGYGARVFYSWNTGQAGNSSSGYSTGITIGSHPNDQGYGFQIVQNLWDDRTYTRRYNGGWQEWKTLAWTSDIPTSLPANGGNADYATSAGSVDWSGVTNRPTNVSQFTNDAGYKTTDTTYSTATSNTLGLVKIGYTANDKNYPVQLSDDGKMYVNVSWTDTDTTYNFSGTTFYSGNSSTAEHNADNAVKNGHYYYTSNGPSTSLGASTSDGALYVQSYSDSWVAQIAQDYINGRLFVRGKNSGTWQDWKRIAITGESQPANGGTSNYVTVSTNYSSSSRNILFHDGNTIYSNTYLTVTPNNGNVTSSGHFYANSDIRYKNIIEYHYSLSDKIAQLPIIKYKWTDRDDDSIRIGSSAQSVMSIIPELVSYDNNTDFYSLDYATLGAVAGISACKEVEMLKQKIKELEQEIIILKSKYNG